MLTSFILTALALSTAANAAVVPRDNDNSKTTYYSGRGSDPDFTISPIQLDAVLSCIGGLENVQKPFLLVPGTWANATMAWDPAWRDLLGKGEGGLGYDVCYVAPPPYMTADIQDTLEYIVNAIHRIYDASGNTMPVMGHSQGALAIQSALTYYPSIRKEVKQYINLAGSLHGTTNVAPVPQANLTTTLRDPAVWQQAPAQVGNWVTTLEQKGGFYNWVPTTSLFSTADGTVRPQVNNSLAGSATYVAGSRSGNILVQESCPDSLLGHNDFLLSNFAYEVVKLAVASSKKYVTTSEVKQAVANGQLDCSRFYAPGADIAAYNTTRALVNGFASGQPRVIAQVYAEPLLRPYIINTPDNKVHDA